MYGKVAFRCPFTTSSGALPYLLSHIDLKTHRQNTLCQQQCTARFGEGKGGIQVPVHHQLGGSAVFTLKTHTKYAVPVTVHTDVQCSERWC